MNKFRYLTSEELLKCFRDRTLFYPVGFSDERSSFIIEAIDIDLKTDNVELTLCSLFVIDYYPIRHHVDQLGLLRGWCFADGSPCGVKCENGIEIGVEK